MKTKMLPVLLCVMLLCFSSSACALTRSQHLELETMADSLNQLRTQFDPGEHFDPPEFLYIPDQELFLVVFPFVDFGASTLRDMMDYSSDLYASMLDLCLSAYDLFQRMVSDISEEVPVIVSIFGNDGDYALVTIDGEDATILVDLFSQKQ